MNKVIKEQWWNDYVGLPYINNGRTKDGLDCWGLVRVIHQEVFNNDLPSFSEVKEEDVKEETIAIQKEGWIEVKNEQAGDVVLFSLAGHPIHVGIVIQPGRFIHAFEGTDSCIESLSNHKWKRRIQGIYRYKTEADSQSVTNLPHPLKTERFSTVLPSNISLAEIAKRIREENNVPEEYGDDAVILVDGYVIPKDNWDTFIPEIGSKVEYRATVGKGLGSVFKMVALVAIAVFAPQILAGINTAFGTTMVAGSFAANATMFAISTVTGMLFDAVFPVRPPSIQSGGSYENEQGTATYTIRGGSNRPNPYGTIPVVLGKGRFTPPSAIQPYYEADGTTSYLRTALCWGYGPLNVSNVRIGETSINSYSEMELYDLHGYVGEDKTKFNELCGKDTEQLIVGVSLDPVLARVKVATISSSVMHVTTRLDHDLLVGMDVTMCSTKDNTTTLYTGIVTAVTSNTLTFNYVSADATLINSTVETNDWYIQGVAWHERTLSEVVNQLKVTVEFPGGLYKTDPNSGAKSGASINIAVEVKKEGGEYYSPTESVIGTTLTCPVIPWNQTKTFSLVLNKATLSLKDEGAIVDGDVELKTLTVKDNSTFRAWLTGNYTDFINYNIESVVNVASTTGFNITNDGRIFTISSGTYTVGGTVISFNKKILSPFAHSVYIPVEQGTYTVRVKRKTIVKHEGYDSDRCTFTGITGFSSRQSITFPKPLCMTAVRAKSTNQFNGNVEGFNADVSSICLDYDYTLNGWGYRETSNPASLYRYVLQHPANANPLPDNKIDLEALKDWHNYCRVNNFTFNYIYQSQESMDSILKDICAAGRASPSRVDGKRSVIVDKPRDYISQHFTPHNSWGFEGSKILPKIPHGFRVQFNNEDKDYQQDELIVYDDGYSESNATLFEGLSLPGVTNSDIVYKQARFHIGQLKLRPEVYSINADIEHLVCNRGDLVKVTHDVPMWGIASGRIKTKVSNTSVELTEDIPMQANTPYSIRLRSQDGSSVIREVVPKTTDGYYSTIDFTSPVDATDALPTDIFMFGNVNEESNNLIVLKIEPSTNMTAKLTLVDYSPELYDIDNSLVIPPFNSNITIPAGLLRKSILEVPIISSLISDDRALTETSDGKYSQGLLVQFRNPTTLPADVKDIEIQWDWAEDNTFDWFTSSLVPISKGSFLIHNTDVNDSYVVRARYVDTYGRSGAWTSEVVTTITGRNRPPSQVDTFIAQEDSDSLRLTWNTAAERDVRKYEVRLSDKDWGLFNSDMVYNGFSNSCYFVPTTASDYTFYLKAISDNNIYGETKSLVYHCSAPNNISNIVADFHDTSITNATVTLRWEPVLGLFRVSGYELSYADQVIFSNSTSITVPANWINDRLFTVKTVDIFGNKSSGYSEVVTKLLPNPPTNVRAQVIDNTVMLYWTNAAKTTLPISHVLIKQGDSWETASIVGPKSGGFTTISELQSGVYTYWLASVDTDGYESTSISISSNVSEPPDFAFHGERVSTFSGTLVNAKKDHDSLVLPVNTTETFSEHFTTNSWNTPEGQVLDGYPIYVQPALAYGTYTEVFDFDTVLPSNKVYVNFVGDVISGNPFVSCDIETSLDGTTWTMYSNSVVILSSFFRYVRLTINVTGDDVSLYKIKALSCRCDAKLITDSGSLACLSTDTNGTLFNFNKEFIDVISATASANSSTFINCVYDFSDVILYGTFSITSNVCSFNITDHGFKNGQNVRVTFSSGDIVSAVIQVYDVATNTFKANVITSDNSGTCSAYSQGAFMYLFDETGTRVSGNASWVIRGY